MKIVESIADDLESGIDNFVSLKSRDENVEDPEEDENGSSDDFWSSGASKLTTNGWVTTDHQDGNGQAGFDTENGDGEAQASRFHFEIHALRFPIDGSHGPCDANTKEHVDSV